MCIACEQTSSSLGPSDADLCMRAKISNQPSVESRLKSRNHHKENAGPATASSHATVNAASSPTTGDTTSLPTAQPVLETQHSPSKRTDRRLFSLKLVSPLKFMADRSLTQAFPKGFFFSGTPRMTSAAVDHDDDNKEEDPDWTWEVCRSSQPSQYENANLRNAFTVTLSCRTGLDGAQMRTPRYPQAVQGVQRK